MQRIIVILNGATHEPTGFGFMQDNSSSYSAKMTIVDLDKKFLKTIYETAPE